MPTAVEQLRDLTSAFWGGREIRCPKHASADMTGEFVQTTSADHIVLTCPVGKETVTIPQRPKQIEFQAQQVEGLVENLERGDAILCFRCQSALEIAKKPTGEAGITEYTFTCVRCFSWGRWVGKPEMAKIGG